MAIPYTFTAQAGPIPLVELDNNFSTVDGEINNLNTYSNYLIDTGGVNTITVAIGSGETATYTAGLQLQVMVAVTNNSAAATINLGGLGAKTILQADGTAIGVGSLLSGGIYGFIYDGTAFRVISNNRYIAAPAAGNSLAITSLGNVAAIVVSGSATGATVGMTVAAAAGHGTIGMEMIDGQAGNTNWALASGFSGTGSFSIRNLTSGLDAVQITATGAVAIPAPTSGNTLALTGQNGFANFALDVTAGNTGSAARITGRAAGVSAITLNTTANTGAATGTNTANKPGGNANTIAWIPVVVDGVNGYIAVYG